MRTSTSQRQMGQAGLRNEENSNAAPRSGKTRGKMEWPLILFVGYLCSLAFEGPVRMIFSLARLETLLYSRDVFTLIAIIWATFQSQTRYTSKANLTSVLLYILICHSVLGLWLGHPLGSTLFAIKIFLALLLGTVCAGYLHTRKEFFVKFIIFLFAGCCFGVYLNVAAGTLPWEGVDFESAFGASTNLVWWAGGERRLPGFARVSTTTAAAIGLTGLFLMSYTKNQILKLLVLGVGVPAVYLTTSKGVILSFLITGCWCFIPSGKIRKQTGIFLLWGSALMAALLPFISAYFQPSPAFMRKMPGFLSSFAERAAITWPKAIEDLNAWHLWLLGQGVGGIGGPLKYGHEYYRYNPIDNLFLYLFTIFGILGIFYYAFAAFRISKIISQDNPFNLGLLAMGIHFFCYGITAHQLEDPLESMWFGMVIAYIPFSWYSGKASAQPTLPEQEETPSKPKRLHRARNHR